LDVAGASTFASTLNVSGTSTMTSLVATTDISAAQLDVENIHIQSNYIESDVATVLELRPGKNTAYNNIGTNSIDHKVRVIGDLQVDGSINFTGTFIRTDTNVDVTTQLDISNAGTGPALIVTQHGANDIMKVVDDTTVVMMVKDGGNIGIGTDSPTKTLDVNGTAIVRQTLDVTGIADFTSAATFGDGVTISSGDLDMTSGFINQV